MEKGEPHQKEKIGGSDIACIGKGESGETRTISGKIVEKGGGGSECGTCSKPHVEMKMSETTADAEEGEEDVGGVWWCEWELESECIEGMKTGETYAEFIFGLESVSGRQR